MGRSPAHHYAARLADCGLEPAQIIAAVRAERGVDLTRRDVARAIAARRQPERDRAAALAKAALASRPGTKTRPARPQASAVMPGAAAAPTMPADGAFPRHVTLMEIHGRGCRNPVSGEGAATLFCGAPALPEKSWCADCMGRLTEPWRRAS